jgi:hypothetical protein
VRTKAATQAARRKRAKVYKVVSVESSVAIGGLRVNRIS